MVGQQCPERCWRLLGGMEGTGGTDPALEKLRVGCYSRHATEESGQNMECEFDLLRKMRWRMCRRWEFLTSLDKSLSISMLSSGFTVASFIDRNCSEKQVDSYYQRFPYNVQIVKLKAYRNWMEECHILLPENTTIHDYRNYAYSSKLLYQIIQRKASSFIIIHPNSQPSIVLAYSISVYWFNKTHKSLRIMKRGLSFPDCYLLHTLCGSCLYIPS